jgi:hypothetical protein
MRSLMERLEYNWWNFQIKVMDESPWIQENLPRLRGIWEVREELIPYLAWSLLGFPLGMILGWLTVLK